MAKTSQMPKSIHSNIQLDAIGEALLKHYNVGITNPWHEAGLSEQETYTRRKLPWADNSYTVSEDGSVSGANAEDIPDGLKNQWASFADEAKRVLGGNEYEDLEAMYEDLVEISP